MTTKTSTYGDALDVCVRAHMRDTGEKSYSAALAAVFERNPQMRADYDEAIRTMAVQDTARFSAPAAPDDPDGPATVLRQLVNPLQDLEDQLERLRKPVNIGAVLLRKRP